MSIILPEEFPIKLGMLAQYKPEWHGRYFPKQPTKAFNEYPTYLPGHVSSFVIQNRDEFEMPKYVIHVAGEYIMRHPTLKRLGTRYLKCFITIPERKERGMVWGSKGTMLGPKTTTFSLQDITLESETILGWVLDTWLEPLEERTYMEVMKSEKRNIAKMYLERLKKTGRILPREPSSR